MAHTVRAMQRIITLLPTRLVDAIENYRYRARVPSRGEAIRRLIMAGLDRDAPQGEAPPSAAEPSPNADARKGVR